MASNRLIAAAEMVDVIDAAGRIIANPERNAPAAPAAEVLALAHATERLWGIALEAAELVRVLRTTDTGNSHQDGLRDDAIQFQMDLISNQMAAICGETNDQEKSDGSRHS